jgi:hypothetical protein
VLTLSGAASVADYEAVLRGLKFSATATRPVGSSVEMRVVVNDGAGNSEAALSKISIHVLGRSSVAGRQVFYNNSAFDGNDPAANAADDAAIASDKVALLPNQAATFANYTNYTRGINGIIIDLAGSHGTITADDFIFRIGNSNAPAHWTYLPQPLVVVRAGAGVGGSDRIELIWADNAIKNAWLEVIMLDNGDTGLAAPDVFLFGNQVGDSGNAPGDTRVSAHDVMRVVNHLLSDGDRIAAVDSPLDYNRDGEISVADLMAAVNQVLAYAVELELIQIEAESALDGVNVAVAMNVIHEPAPFSVARPLVPVGEATFNIQNLAWQLEDEELEVLAQQPVVSAPLMLDPNA